MCLRIARHSYVTSRERYREADLAKQSGKHRAKRLLIAHTDTHTGALAACHMDCGMRWHNVSCAQRSRVCRLVCVHPPRAAAAFDAQCGLAPGRKFENEHGETFKRSNKNETIYFLEVRRKTIIKRRCAP